jgi:cob(I)alamin adenosyltransferase
MTKIYTKTGDEGKTSFVGGERVSKNDLRIEATGTLDELNSVLGVTLGFVTDEKIQQVIVKAQHDLFTLGAELSWFTSKASTGTRKLPLTSPDQVKELEGHIDELDALLTQPTSFILPKGTQASTFLHLARTVCRRAERLIVSLSQQYPLNPEIIKYMNRLSDLLYVMARYANKEFASGEQQPIYKYFKEQAENNGGDPK